MLLLSATMASAAPPVAPPLVTSLSAADCQACHPKIVAEWSQSRHAHAATNDLFRSAFRRDPLDWCLRCHAPLPAQAASFRQASTSSGGADNLVAQGVNCAVCHLRDGQILTARPVTERGQRAHPLRQVPQLQTAEFCAVCHQANWPRTVRPLVLSEVPMQDTLAEFRRAGIQERTCQDCHMPGRSHRFPGGHDANWLRQTVSLRVTRDRAQHLQVALLARGIGHQLPTGDPFRRFLLDICRDPECDEPVVSFSLGRFFDSVGGEKVLLRDTSLPVPRPGQPSERRFSYKLPPSVHSAELFFRLQYAYAAPSTEPELDPEQVATLLSSGRVPGAP
ncbi:hypothetical protein BVG81_003460 [Haliangium sp. UPWRP_2]|nr:hypothetical protein BVG81_003460 [Haliangium sp. UPWRP_2]